MLYRLAVAALIAVPVAVRAQSADTITLLVIPATYLLWRRAELTRERPNT